MKSFLERVRDYTVPAGHVAVYWLGQAGFLFKTADERLVLLDPYFSDCCYRHFGFKRVMAYLMDADEVNADLLLVSHAHYDHLDVDAVADVLKNGKTRLWAAKDVEEEAVKLGLPAEQIAYMAIGDTLTDGDITVKAVACDHGELAPDALGFWIAVAGKTIYYMGDTAYRPDRLVSEELQGADLLIAPINGAFGNLNEAQAADAARLLNAKMTVPCHFWNFAEHGGNPFLFMEAMGDTPYTLMGIGGEPILL